MSQDSRAYGPYGEPSNWSGPRFAYTGQIGLPQLSLYHYKARAYDPAQGRFLQTDPSGYGDGMNLYAYVKGDPLNGTDPSGLAATPISGVTVTNPGYFSGPMPEPLGRLLNLLSLIGFRPVGVVGPGNVDPPKKDGEPEVSEVVVTAEKKRTQQPLPAYCSSVGYQIGDYIDQTLGRNAQNVGAAFVVSGTVIGVVGAFTGAGAGAGGALVGAGGVVYAGGTALSAVGNGIKFLNGQSAAITAASLFSLPTVRMGPLSQVITEKALSYVVAQSIINPCD